LRLQTLESRFKNFSGWSGGPFCHISYLVTQIIKERVVL
jgi:hypothetical protein